MDVQVIHYEVNGFRLRVLKRQMDLGELGCGSIRRGESEAPTRFGLYGAEDIGRATAFVLVIPPRFAPRLHMRCRTHVRVSSQFGFFVGRKHGAGDVDQLKVEALSP